MVDHMSTKSKHNETQDKQRPVETFREGAIAAHVWKRQTSTGFEYLEFSLSRSWKLKSGEKEGYSSNFFEQNQDALISVIKQASDYIRERSIAEEQQEPQDRASKSFAVPGQGKTANETLSPRAVAS
jgi:hypothetical protein